MDLKSVKSSFSRNIINIPGWRTRRKIVIIESDDWGTIRMASQSAYNRFLKAGLPVDQCPYNRYDALESNEDLEALFEVLSSVKDKNGNPGVITANNIVANPDFERIESDQYQTYHFEPFTATLERYPNHDRVLELYREGIDRKLFYPQFHGREHLNVTRWMKAIRQGNRYARLAFEERMFSVHAETDPLYKNEFMDALDLDSEDQQESLSAILSSGLTLFHSIWGFPSQSFIAPCYIWSSELELTLKLEKVQYIQGMIFQFVPKAVNGTIYKKRYHYLGQRNRHDQLYLIRNCFFEPSQAPDFDWVDDCMRRISIAFKWGKPAIISAHRLNFIGFLHAGNRDRNLFLLGNLLRQIVNKWPEIEFMTSEELGNLMNQIPVEPK